MKRSLIHHKSESIIFLDPDNGFSFKDKGKVIIIDAIIYVERESQKGIMLGKKGVQNFLQET